MKKIKKYFSPYSKPPKPNPPLKSILKSEGIKVITIGNYDSTDIPQQADHLYVEIEEDYGDKRVILHFSNQSVIDNPNYEEQYKAYLEALKAHKDELKEWKEQKEEWDKEQEDSQRRLYEKLKEKFDGKS